MLKKHKPLISYFQVIKRHDSCGASMLEYALMAALIAVVVLTAVQFLGEEAKNTFFYAACAAGGYDVTVISDFLGCVDAMGGG